MTKEQVEQHCDLKEANGQRALTLSGAAALVMLTGALGWIMVMKPDDFGKVDVIAGMVVIVIKDLFQYYFNRKPGSVE